MRIISAFQPFAISKLIVDKATNVFLKPASLDVKETKTVQTARIASITIVPFHQVCIHFLDLGFLLKMAKSSIV